MTESLDQKVMKLLEEGKISPEAAREMLRENSQTDSNPKYSQPIIQTPIKTKNKKSFRIWPWMILALGISGYFIYTHPIHLQNQRKNVEHATPENENEGLSSALFSRVQAFNSRDNLNLQYGHLEDAFAIFSPDTYCLTIAGNYTTVVSNVQSGRYWESTKLDLSKLENPKETSQWSAWEVGKFLIFGNKEKIKLEGVVCGIGVFPKGDFQFVNLSRSEKDIAYEKELDQIHERAMQGEPVDPIYTTDSYGSRREWVQAGDLELMVTDYKLSKETNFPGTGDGHYKRRDEYKLYVDIKIKNNYKKRFAFDLSKIYLSGVSETQKAEKPTGGIEYIPAYATVDEEYSFWVTKFSEEFVTLTMPKLEWWGENGSDGHGGTTYINLEKLPKMEFGELH